MAELKTKRAQLSENVRAALNLKSENVRSVLNLNPLPETGYIRLSQLIGDLNADPPIPPIVPAGKSSIWSWVKQGNFPRPVKLGPRVTAWDVRAIRQWQAEREAACQCDDASGDMN